MNIMHSMKKLLSLLLCAVMIVGMLPTPVFAAEGDACVADGCDGIYAEGFCNVCGAAEEAEDEPEEECAHTGGEATCKAAAVCEKCGESYGETADHDYVDGICSVCEAVEPVEEPQDVTVGAWEWVDEYEVLDEEQNAVIPGVSAENPIDLDTLTALLPQTITAVVGEETVEVAVTWICEAFPAEGATSGDYVFTAELPEGYALAEDAAALELNVSLGGAAFLGDPYWGGEELYAEKAWETGSGTESDPYVITSAHQLAKLAKDVNEGESYEGVYFRLGTSLNLNGANRNWTPIGNETNAFAGEFDGDGQTINAMSAVSTGGYVGLFGNVSGSVKNLTMDSPVVQSGANYAGGVAGYSDGGSFSNITVKNPTVKQTAASNSTGGVVGYLVSAGATIDNCFVIGGSVYGFHVGGIVGYIAGKCTVTLCGVTDVAINSFGKDASVGGIVGHGKTGTTVTACYNVGSNLHSSTGGTSYLGGIAGRVDAIYSCYASMNITGAKGTEVVAPITGRTGHSGYKPKVGYCAYNSTAYTRTKNPHANGSAFTAAEVAAGAAAYFLANNGLDDANAYTDWGQKIGSDSHPVWSTALEKIVHRAGEEGNYTYFNLVNPVYTMTVETPDAPYTYDGEAKEPSVTVTVSSGAHTLTVPADAYSVSYENNVNAGTATVSVSDLPGGKFAVSAEDVTFTIGQRNLENATLTLVPVSSEFTGSKQTVNVSVQDLDADLTLDVDYVIAEDSVLEADDVGEYTVTVNAVAGGNYVGSLSGKWAVTQAENEWSKQPEIVGWTYGEEPNDPIVEAKFGNDTLVVEYSVKGENAYSTTVPTAAGQYNVRFTVAETEQYSGLQDTTVILEIAPATLTVTAENKTVTYGEAAPEFTIKEIEGFKNGDTAEILGGTLAFECAYTQGNDAGEYAIIPSGYTADNYEIQYNNGTLTVEAKEVTIIWDETPLVYNGEPQAPAATVGNLVGEDTCVITVTGQQTDAGKGYIATAASLSNDNYKLPAENTVTFEILSAEQEAPANVAAVAETIMDKDDGKITGVDATMEYRLKSAEEYTAITGEEVTGLAAGTYCVRYAAKPNYNPSADVEIVIAEGRMLQVTLPDPQVGYSIESDLDEIAYQGEITLTYTLAAGYTEGETFAVTSTSGTVTKNEDGTFTVTGIEADATINVVGVSDVTAPTAEIKVTTHVWNAFLNSILDIYFKETQTVNITAEDAGSGVDAIYYYLAPAQMTLDQVKAITNWTEYAGKFNINPENKYVIYAKAVDYDGNTVYISSDGIVLDATVPAITGVTNGATYYTTQQITAVDNRALESLTLNGEDFTGTIPGDVELQYTICATDKAGNSTTFVINMKAIASIGKDLPTEDTVEVEDKADILAVKQAASNVLANQSASATAGEKAKLQQIIDDCDDLLAMIKNVEDLQAMFQATLPDPNKVEPDDLKAIYAYDAAVHALLQLTEDEQRMVSDESMKALADLYEALTDYKVIEVSGRRHNSGDNTGLTFVVNGYYGKLDSYQKGAYGKFVGIKVNGAALSRSNYTVVAGSTIVTLRPEYLNTLNTGKYDITFVYVDGEVDGRFQIVHNVADNPFTGDNSNMMLWGAMGAISMFCLAMMFAFMAMPKKKKGRYQN